ncbi:MAG: chorismate mutase [Negativicutes bacterium]|nr:chorismate mutase [Negativicutes bacterium]
MDLETYRKQLNEIDDALTALFCRRMEIVAAIAAYKQARQLPVFDPSREAGVVERLTKAQEPGCAAGIAALYETIFRVSRAYQQTLRQKNPEPESIQALPNQAVEAQKAAAEEHSQQAEMARPLAVPAGREEQLPQAEQPCAESKAPFGLLGCHLQHSHSPMIHRQLAAYGYQLFDIPPAQLREFMQTGEFRGLNVTIPYKQSVMEFCREVSPLAQRINAVNTIYRREDGSLYGHNTDYAGLDYCKQQAGIRLQGRKVLILGTGATSRTAHVLAEDSGAVRIRHVSRSGPIHYQNLAAQRDTEVIINTTPVGTFPNNGAGLLDLRQFPDCRGVIDVIYNPLATDLLLQARQLGIPSTNGLPMLVAQAKAAAELFSQSAISEQKMEQILRQMQHSLSNLILIGMPGCGKTSVGRLLAEKMQRTFFDSDERIEAEQGMSVAQLIAVKGEAEFRDLETNVIERLGKVSGCVIATGGGSILRQRNRNALQQNGYLVWLQRDLTKLCREDRPLSLSEAALTQMYAHRAPIYRDTAQAFVDNNGSLTAAVNLTKEYFDAHFNHQRS